MKARIRLVSAILALLLILVCSVFPEAMSGFPSAAPDYPAAASEGIIDDITGHWAETALRQSYRDGIIVGDGNSLLPDANASAAQVLAIICRALDATVPADISAWGLPENVWYYDCTAKAAYLGLISSADSRNLLAPISRQNAFYLLAEGFQLVKAKPDLSVLDQFSDSRLITDTRRQAIASLVSDGLVVGSYGKLHVNSYVTRAEILTLLYRIVGEYIPAPSTYVDYMHGVMLQGPAMLSGGNFNKGVWFDCSASDISLRGVKADRAAIRSHSLDSLTVSGSARIGTLTLAAQSGNITFSPEDGAIVDTLVIGAGRGQVTAGGVKEIDVTGNDRRVMISEGVEKIIVYGRNNVIHVQEGAHVGRIELLRNAVDSRVVIDGEVQELEIIGLGAVVKGSGYAGTLMLSHNHSSIDVKHGNVLDIIDQGLIEASVKINMPVKLPAGDTLVASATVEKALPDLKCGVTWYIDDIPVMEGTFETGSDVPKLSHNFIYAPSMQGSANVRISIKYVTMQGERQEISAAATVILENYNKQHWMGLDAPGVLSKVTTGYKGDFTLEWALANDLDDYEKEVWVYAKGYTSSTEYLLWVSIAYQRVNVFKNTDGCWELIRTCIVGTGAPNSPTGTMVTTVTYKQYYGWTTSSYTVKPVVRFRRGSGYAFHSRTFYPNTSKLRDERIGFPISRGCIRMYDEDIWYLYDYIPDGTTVVVF